MVLKKRKLPKISDQSCATNSFKAKSIDSFNIAGLPSPDPFCNQHYDNTSDMDNCLELLDQQSMGSEMRINSLTPTIKQNLQSVKDSVGINCSVDPIQQNANDSELNLLFGGGVALSSIQRPFLKKKWLNGVILPNIQVELARHKLMGDLSHLLLSKYSILRMPTFERWILDSKIEERLKRITFSESQKCCKSTHSNVGENHSSSKWKNRRERKRKSPGFDAASPLQPNMLGKSPVNLYDPVLPSIADVNDKASQRLLKEIDEHAFLRDEKKRVKYSDESEKDVEERKQRNKAFVVDLCRRACDASRYIQDFNTRVGGGVDVKKYFMLDSSGKKMNKKAKERFRHSSGRIVLEHGERQTNSGKSKKDGNDDVANSNRFCTKEYSLLYIRKIKASLPTKPFLVKINATHYEKLREMFNAIHSSNTKQNSESDMPMLHVPPISALSKKNYDAATNVFHHLVFCLLVRYASLSGGQQILNLRGGGMQGAIHSQIFDFLSNYIKSSSITSVKHHKISECFASPLNVYNPNYCSLFHEDLDWHFGSVGDFFSIPLGFFGDNGQVHQVNPPFAPGLMELMVKQIEDHLSFADHGYEVGHPERKKKTCHNGHKLTFIIIVPYCERNEKNRNLIHKFTQKSFNDMLESRYFSKHIILKARDHGYVEGSQHSRPTRYKDSQYDTSVFLLQSLTALKDEQVSLKLTSQEFEVGLRKAFTSKHRLEMHKRRGEEVCLND